MRPIMMLLLLLILAACTIRETYAPSDAHEDGLALRPSAAPSAPIKGDDEPCMGAFARRSYLPVDRDGTQDLFCN